LDLDGLLRFAVEQGASDVHLKVGSRPRLRVDGRLREGPFDTVEPTDTERLVAAVIPRPRAETFAAENECDFMYGIAGLGRFRVSAFRQRGYVGMVLRRVLPGIPSFEALGLPATVADLAREQHGLLLVTGLAGAGKTASLSATSPLFAAPLAALFLKEPLTRRLILGTLVSAAGVWLLL